MSNKTIITVNEKIVSLQDRIATLTRQLAEAKDATIDALRDLAERDAEVEAAKRGVFREDGTWWCRVSERDAALAEVERLRGQTCAMCQPLHAQLTAANATLAAIKVYCESPDRSDDADIVAGHIVHGYIGDILAKHTHPPEPKESGPAPIYVHNGMEYYEYDGDGGMVGQTGWYMPGADQPTIVPGDECDRMISEAAGDMADDLRLVCEWMPGVTYRVGHDGAPWWNAIEKYGQEFDPLHDANDWMAMLEATNTYWDIEKEGVFVVTIWDGSIAVASAVDTNVGHAAVRAVSAWRRKERHDDESV